MRDGIPDLVLFDPSSFDLPLAWVEGLCRLCSRPRTACGHDACISELRGVTHACCGHGVEMPYIVTDGGHALYGAAAVRLMRELGGSPP